MTNPLCIFFSYQKKDNTFRWEKTCTRMWLLSKKYKHTSNLYRFTNFQQTKKDITLSFTPPYCPQVYSRQQHSFQVPSFSTLMFHERPSPSTLFCILSPRTHTVVYKWYWGGLHMCIDFCFTQIYLLFHHLGETKFVSPYGFGFICCWQHQLFHI